MKITSKLLVTLSLAVMPGSIFAQNQIPADSQPAGPEIEVVDGKITMSALGVPLGRIVTMMDRAMGFQSKVAPEAANRSVSVRIKDLPVKDAVMKILEGQPVNYMLIEGKVIVATEEGPVTYEAPRLMVSKAGTKRFIPYVPCDTCPVRSRLLIGLPLSVNTSGFAL